MKLDIIIPSYHSEVLTSLCIKTFEKFRGGKDFRYIVVENSNDVTYKDNIESLSTDVLWVQNPTDLINSEANAIAIETGLKYVESERVFICHNDVAAVQEDWLDFLLDKMDNEGCAAAAFVLDNSRINALHISGILVDASLARSVSMYPVYKDGQQTLDVGDSITRYCRDNNLKYFCCDNTHNNSFLEENCYAPYNELSHVDRAFNSKQEIIFLHLGRGAPKTMGTYSKDGRITLDNWAAFIEKNILDF